MDKISLISYKQSLQTATTDHCPYQRSVRIFTSKTAAPSVSKILVDRTLRYHLLSFFYEIVHVNLPLKFILVVYIIRDENFKFAPIFCIGSLCKFFLYKILTLKKYVYVTNNLNKEFCKLKSQKENRGRSLH